MAGGSLHHFVVAPTALQGDIVCFTPEQSHQIARVLRQRSGDEVIVLDGQGAQYLVRLEVGHKTVIGSIVGPADACREPARRVALLVAAPRGERWDWLLQKGTEIGLSRFSLIVTRYAQPGAATVRPRHHQIVREATEQCRRLLVPPIDAPRAFPDALAALRERHQTAVLLWEGIQEHTLVATLQALDSNPGAGDLCLIVGPEGGFHPDEIALARDAGIPLAGLGPLILRTETAALVAAAIALSAGPPGGEPLSRGLP